MMRFILLYLLTLHLTLLSTAKLMWRRTLRPLIGGPHWLRIHQVLEISSTSGGKIETDFVPKRPQSLPDLNLLLLGFTVDGLTRIRRFDFVDDDELGVIYRKLSALEYPEGLNLYRNNCFDYVEHCIVKLNLLNLDSNNA